MFERNCTITLGCTTPNGHIHRKQAAYSWLRSKSYMNRRMVAKGTSLKFNRFGLEFAMGIDVAGSNKEVELK